MKANELNIKDLMLDDWVRFIYNPRHDEVEWTGQIIPQMFQHHTDYHLFGIPLTPEILEKNGFVARYAYGQKKWHIDIYNDFHRKFDDNGDITLNVYSERKMEWRLSIDTGRNERTVIYIRFIHELQHALRLCGIEKEVVL